MANDLFRQLHIGLQHGDDLRVVVLARDVQRAEAVATALVRYGVPRERIASVTGVGYDDPVHPAGADAASTAAANRVVVVTVRTVG